MTTRYSPVAVNPVSGALTYTGVATVAAPVVWLDASSIGLADGAAVASWPDVSGNGHNLSQGTAANRTAMTGILNGRPVVRFDGTNDEMASGVADFSTSTTRTIIAVGKKGGVGGGASRLWGFGATASVYDTGGGFGYYQEEGAATVNLGGNSANFTIVTIAAASAASLTPYLNGTAGTAFNPVDTLGTETQFVVANSIPGGADLWNGEIAEIIIGTFTSAERQLLERWLGAKYGITVA